MLNALWMVDELVWHRSVSHCVLRPFCIRVLCNVRHDCHVIARCGVTCVVGSSRRERGEHIATIPLCPVVLRPGKIRLPTVYFLEQEDFIERFRYRRRQVFESRSFCKGLSDFCFYARLELQVFLSVTNLSGMAPYPGCHQKHQQDSKCSESPRERSTRSVVCALRYVRVNLPQE